MNMKNLMFVGLIIISIAIGHQSSPFEGWMVLGSGLTIIGVCSAIVGALERQSRKRRGF